MPDNPDAKYPGTRALARNLMDIVKDLPKDKFPDLNQQLKEMGERWKDHPLQISPPFLQNPLPFTPMPRVKTPTENWTDFQILFIIYSAQSSTIQTISSPTRQQADKIYEILCAKFGDDDVQSGCGFQAEKLYPELPVES